MKFTKKAIKLTAAIAGTMALGTAATVTTANADTIYTVQAGDTLSGISYKYAHNLNMVDSLAANNKIANKNLIYVGQKLVIKDDGEIKPATAQQVATLPAANQTNNNNQTQQSAPAAKTSAPAQQSAPVANNQQAAAPATTSNYASYTSNVAGNDAAAKAWIAARESGGNYGARNGQYVGKYQLSASYLNGDYSAANQERVADQYVASRYGSWSGAQAFWQSHGWY